MPKIKYVARHLQQVGEPHWLEELPWCIRLVASSAYQGSALPAGQHV